MDSFCSIGDSNKENCPRFGSCQPPQNPFSIVQLDKFTVIVEGNIGCGKSTFLHHFENSSQNLEVLQEPVELWKNVRGFNIFDLMYQDQSNWFSAFQSYVLLTLMKQQTTKQTSAVRLIERSVFSARHCFIENMYQHKKIDEMQFRILDDWFTWACNSGKLRVDLFVYLRATPETCLERIKVRSRSEEETIPLSYLEQLHEHHEDWLIRHKHGKPPAPVLVIDTNQPLVELRKVYERYRLNVMCGVE